MQHSGASGGLDVVDRSLGGVKYRAAYNANSHQHMHWCCICLWVVHKHWGWWEWEKRPNHLFTHSRITHSASTFCTNSPADTFSEKTMYVLHTAVSIQRVHPQSNTKNTSYCPVSIVMVLACVMVLAQYFGGRVTSYPGSQIIMFKQYGCERTTFKKQKAIIPSHNMILNTTLCLPSNSD